MKKNSIFSIGVLAALTLSLGFSEESDKRQADVSNGDKYKVVTVEEQQMLENKDIEGNNLKTVISTEEQNRVENSSTLSGFVSQENGQGFYFAKEN